MPNAPSKPAEPAIRLYDDHGDALMSKEQHADILSLLPGSGGTHGTGKVTPGARLRLLWGQSLIRDLVDGRYRTVVCGVNDVDNSHGIIAQLAELVHTSQWSARTITSYAQMFHQSVGVHAAHDREPYVLKFDLDKLLIFALLRPRGRQHFTLLDLERGFTTVSKMLRDRHDREPVASVSFLNARANRLVGDDGKEPTFETVLRTMHTAGFRGDVYPAPGMWKLGHVGVFPSYPFPEGLDEMRKGSS